MVELLSRRKFVALSGSFIVAAPFIHILPVSWSSDVLIRRTIDLERLLRESEAMAYHPYPQIFASRMRNFVLRTPGRVPTMFTHRDSPFGIYAAFRKDDKEQQWAYFRRMAGELCDLYDELEVV